MKRWNKNRLTTVLHRGLMVCLALALALGFGVEVLAAKEGKVTASAANIRSSASAGAEKVAKLSSGTAFTVTEETTDGDGYVWYNIVFTLDGAQKSGWIRSDLAEVTEVEAPAEEGGETAPAPATVDGITIQEPAGQPEVTDDFTATQITVGETAFTAWAVNGELTGGAEFYLVYGVDAAGVSGWYFYDVQQGTLQRAAGQYMGGGSDESEGLIEALRMENEELQKGQTKTLKVRNYIIIALAILCVLLLVIVIVLAVKLNQTEYVDDDYDEEDEEEESDDRKAGIPSWMEVARARKEEERRQKAQKDELDDMFEEDEEEEYKPRQVRRVVQPAPQEPKRAAARAVEKQARRGRVEDDDFDDDEDEDFDVELLDLDDLNL